MHTLSTLTPPSNNIALALASFAHRLEATDIPAAVWKKSVHHIVDAIGLAFASSHFPFAGPALTGICAAAGQGEASVIGHDFRLAPRDAALANGYLIHGLDFDDTHPGSIVHPTVACLPTALALAESCNAHWETLIVAYVAGMETAIRLGRAVKGGFHHVGFHATGIVSHFSSAVVAGKLLGLTVDEIVAAQGIAASTASGVQVFLEDGAWTKRMHPGWGALAGITAAHMAKAGFAGPRRPYEGRFGLIDTHLQAHAEHVDADSIAADLGRQWTLLDTSIKPYPVCHFIHGCAEAALILRREVGPDANIARIVCELPAATLPIVAEPAARKKLPKNDYEAKFSAQFVVAACVIRNRFTLEELSDDSLKDVEILALAEKVTCIEEKNSPFPQYFSGKVTLELADGRSVKADIPINLGSGERALDVADIERKFRGNAGLVKGDAEMNAILDGFLNASSDAPVRTLTALLR